MDVDLIHNAPLSHPATDDVDTTRKQKSIALPPHDVELEEYPGRDEPLCRAQPWSSTSSSSIDESAVDLETLAPLSQTVSQPRRVSIDQFYMHHIPDRPALRPRPPARDPPPPPSTSTATITSTIETQSPRRTADDLVLHSPTSPPPYSSSIRSRSTLNITPRAEEGRETLPPYTCDLALRSLFLRKSELEGPLHRAPMRAWHRVHVALQGTALTITHCPRMVLPRSKPPPPPRTYSLQHAEAGIASDYLKRRYVIRLRLEADQLLLASEDAPTHVLWLEALTAAIDLAPALDERSLPVDVSLPRPRRQRPRPRFIAAGSAAARRAAAESAAASATTSSAPEPATTPTPPPDPDPSPLTPQESPTPSTTSTSTSTTTSDHPPARLYADPYSIYPPTLTHTHRHTKHASSGPNPNLTKDGKWRPVHNWSPLYDLIYAKRCMATLTSGSPRKGPFVIMGGERWVVDWETGGCVRWVPGGGEGQSGSGGRVGDAGEEGGEDGEVEEEDREGLPAYEA